ncbi:MULTISPECIES: bacteriocin [unclassified Prochlorococcus]|uniref:bacteriocin n=1 Tax=unclassified Prochlorococcus TaxID=2627481 RepID=UPI0005338D4A|nr:MULTISPECIES: bacteriocin [unclassified Prochlorococcus]KGG27475.1 hypothetical protein EV13_2140 [Prochlorococcus sp. MIT 0702]KGG27669.1 hypothetical protein EV12_1099 [Prochlorococcus sp. MIT 0701]KGG31909.1 hypothetical protein EV14_2117 [Prochlorococcus sp. MIT 0703]
MTTINTDYSNTEYSNTEYSNTELLDQELTNQELSHVSGGIVPVFENPVDGKEWREGFEKHCTKPSKHGRYPEDCFFGFPY